jgi:hypothetical protein
VSNVEGLLDAEAGEWRNEVSPFDGRAITPVDENAASLVGTIGSV